MSDFNSDWRKPVSILRRFSLEYSAIFLSHGFPLSHTQRPAAAVLSEMMMLCCSGREKSESLWFFFTVAWVHGVEIFQHVALRRRVKSTRNEGRWFETWEMNVIFLFSIRREMSVSLVRLCAESWKVGMKFSMPLQKEDFYFFNKDTKKLQNLQFRMRCYCFVPGICKNV